MPVFQQSLISGLRSRAPGFKFPIPAPGIAVIAGFLIVTVCCQPALSRQDPFAVGASDESPNPPTTESSQVAPAAPAVDPFGSPPASSTQNPDATSTDTTPPDPFGTVPTTLQTTRTDPFLTKPKNVEKSEQPGNSGSNSVSEATLPDNTADDSAGSGALNPGVSETLTPDSSTTDSPVAPAQDTLRTTPYGRDSESATPAIDPSAATPLDDFPSMKPSASNPSPFGNASPSSTSQPTTTFDQSSTEPVSASPFGTPPTESNSVDPPASIYQQEPVTAQPAVTQPGIMTRPSNTGSSSNRNDGEFARLFWRYLSANNYKNWTPAPGEGEDFYSSEIPHGTYIKSYFNRKAAANPGNLPFGSVIVIESYRPDKTLQSISAMMRSDGFNPPAGDWYWVTFNPDGSVAEGSGEGGSNRITGRVDSCINCHQSADENDYTFFNDN